MALERRHTARVVVLGGPGGGEVTAQIVAAVAQAGGPLRLHGYLNDGLAVGHPLHHGVVLGPLEAWADQPPDVRFLAPLHKAGAMAAVIDRVESLGIPDDRWATALDPSAAMAAGVEVGPGSVVAAHVTVQPGATLGRHVALRPGAMVGHDSVLADFAFVGGNAAICGRCRLDVGAYVAPGAVLRNDLHIGRLATAGLGAVVVRDVEAGAVVAGNPAAPITSATP